MNLEFKPFRELIEYASRNDHDVVIRRSYCLIELSGSPDYIIFFEVNDGLCIIKGTYGRAINPVKITVEDFKSIFS
ncbi:hypothetical protein [Citrobacter meridianamericanus]|uniref:hypothetical protein n=1 Tax=Citrobacter meridianamericanus TaxID=2894201 RepID=UPI00351D591D